MKSWWCGDKRVEPYMLKVTAAISRHIDRSVNQDAHTDIYNRAYEAIYAAIIDTEKKPNISNVLAKPSEQKGEG